MKNSINPKQKISLFEKQSDKEKQRPQNLLLFISLSLSLSLLFLSKNSILGLLFLRWQNIFYLLTSLYIFPRLINAFVVLRTNPFAR